MSNCGEHPQDDAELRRWLRLAMGLTSEGKCDEVFFTYSWNPGDRPTTYRCRCTLTALPRPPWGERLRKKMIHPN